MLKFDNNVTSDYICFLWSLIMIFIFVMWIIVSINDSFVNFKRIILINFIVNNLCNFTKLISIINSTKTSISMNNKIFMKLCLIAILIFQFNWLVLMILKTFFLNCEKVIVTTTKRKMFFEIFNSWIFLRTFLSFCFRTRRCSKTFNFSNRN